jgi:hypothetical protein
MVLDHEGDYPSRWASAVSVAEKIGCAPSMLHEWVKRTEVDSVWRANTAQSAGIRLVVLRERNVMRHSSPKWRVCLQRLCGLRRSQDVAPDAARRVRYRPLHRRAATARHGLGRGDPWQARARNIQRQGCMLPP